jgi:hypothetical protein
MKVGPDAIRQCIKAWLEQGQDEVSDELTHVVKDIYDLKIRHRSVAERYLTGELEVCFDFLAPITAPS